MVNVFVPKPCTPDRASGTGLRSWGKRKVKKKRREPAKIKKKKKKSGEPSRLTVRLARSILFIFLNKSLDLALFNVRKSQYGIYHGLFEVFRR